MHFVYLLFDKSVCFSAENCPSPLFQMFFIKLMDRCGPSTDTTVLQVSLNSSGHMLLNFAD